MEVKIGKWWVLIAFSENRVVWIIQNFAVWCMVGIVVITFLSKLYKSQSRRFLVKLIILIFGWFCSNLKSTCKYRVFMTDFDLMNHICGFLRFFFTLLHSLEKVRWWVNKIDIEFFAVMFVFRFPEFRKVVFGISVCHLLYVRCSTVSSCHKKNTKSVLKILPLTLTNRILRHLSKNARTYIIGKKQKIGLFKT